MLIEIKNLFTIISIFGGALILYGNYSGLYIITIIVSVLVMLIYFFISLYINNKNRQISIEQLGDSNYYLGFYLH
jgi:ABC-type multidrug transport system permease subunit